MKFAFDVARRDRNRFRQFYCDLLEKKGKNSLI
jgi:hypothetical protein